MPAFGVLIYFHYLSSIRTRVDQIAEDTRRSRKENRPVGPGIGWQSGFPYQSAPSGAELLKSLNGSVFDFYYTCDTEKLESSGKGDDLDL